MTGAPGKDKTVNNRSSGEEDSWLGRQIVVVGRGVAKPYKESMGSGSSGKQLVSDVIWAKFIPWAVIFIHCDLYVTLCIPNP